MKYVVCAVMLLSFGMSYSQDSTRVSDTVGRSLLQEVVVHAYEQNRALADVPVAIGVVTTAEWNRYNKMSIVPAINSVPGVRMEERSPGSYRLSFRGSTLSFCPSVSAM